MFRRLRRRYHLLLGGEVAAVDRRARRRRADDAPGDRSRVGPRRPQPRCHALPRRRRRRTSWTPSCCGSSRNSPPACGERIELTIFNGSAITVFPLTDDAEFIADLNEAARSLGQRKRVRRGHRGGRHLADRRWPGFVRDALRQRSARPALDRLRHRQRPRRRSDPPVARGGGTGAARAIRAAIASRPHHGRGPRRVARRRRIDRQGGVRDGRTNDDRRGRRRDRTARSEPPRRASEVVADDRPTAWIVACFAGLGALFAIGWGLRR